MRHDLTRKGRDEGFSALSLFVDGATVVKSEVRARSQLVAVRLTPEEKATFAAFAERQQRSLPDLMRLAVEAAMLHEARP